MPSILRRLRTCGSVLGLLAGLIGIAPTSASAQTVIAGHGINPDGTFAQDGVYGVSYITAGVGGAPRRYDLATKFRTPSGPAHRLAALKVACSSSTAPELFAPVSHDYTLQIVADNAGPGATVLETLPITVTTTASVITAHSTLRPSLSPDTDYWLVFNAPNYASIANWSRGIAMGTVTSRTNQGTWGPIEPGANPLPDFQVLGEAEGVVPEPNGLLLILAALAAPVLVVARGRACRVRSAASPTVHDALTPQL